MKAIGPIIDSVINLEEPQLKLTGDLQACVACADAQTCQNHKLKFSWTKIASTLQH
jgi:hypothetical protein